jgi:hypothetical protein
MASAVTYSYDNKAIKEDLLSLITNLDFKEYQLGSGLSQSKANAVIHQWLNDTLKTPAANAAAEGADASFTKRTAPTRSTNFTQIITIPYEVSGTDRASNAAGYGDRYAYEMEKAMKEFKQDQEFALMRGTLVCGAGTVARSLSGVKAWLTGNVTAQSGTSYTESILNDDLQSVWEDGTEVNAIYAPMYIKRKISAFTAGATKNVDTTDRRLVNAVDIYQADAAKNVKLFAHRFVTVSGDTNYDVVGINEDFFKIAYLRNPKNEVLAKTGDADKAQIIGEMTLECLSANAGFKRTAVL